MEKQELSSRKADFAEFISHKFEPQANVEVSIVEFPDFFYLRDSNQLDAFYPPGIVAIHCFATNRTLFTSGKSVFYRMWLDYGLLMNYDNELPDLLRKDYSENELNSFIFIVFCIGPEWESFEKREMEIQRLVSFWPYELYKFHDES